MRRIFVLLGLSIFASAPAIASPALTAKTTILRATASSHGKVIQALPANVQIDVDKCGNAAISRFPRSRRCPKDKRPAPANIRPPA